MKKYIGTKQVEAEPMTLGDFIARTGRNPYKNPNEHDPEEDGYFVRYKDGYESWSPSKPFEEAYKCADTFLDRLHIEQKDLAEKLEKLSLFVESPKFTDAVQDSNQRKLLLKQCEYMGEYLNVLNQRINSLQ